MIRPGQAKGPYVGQTADDIEDHEVMSDAADAVPGFLAHKIEAGDYIDVSLDTLTTDHLTKISLEDHAETHNVSGGDQVTPWLYGTGDPPSPAGLIDGTLYFKYTADELPPEEPPVV